MAKYYLRPRSILFWKVYTSIYAWRIKLLNWNKDSILLARSCNFFREKLEQLHWFGILQDFDLHLQLWYALLKYFFEKLFFFSIVGFKYLFSSLHFASACEFVFFLLFPNFLSHFLDNVSKSARFKLTLFSKYWTLTMIIVYFQVNSQIIKVCSKLENNVDGREITFWLLKRITLYVKYLFLAKKQK